MTSAGVDAERTVGFTADREPFPVVFEMLAHTVVVQAHESLRLVVKGPSTAELTIGYGSNLAHPSSGTRTLRFTSTTT